MKNDAIAKTSEGGRANFLIEGYGVQIEWDSPEIGPIVERLSYYNFRPFDGVPALRIEVGSGEFGYRVSMRGRESGVYSLEMVPSALEQKIQLEVATHAPEAIFVHCGVVRYNNSVILIPGKSFSGKSTLVYALCRAGAAYYSDEYAVVDSEGRVRPWPRAISLRGGSSEGYRERERIDARELGWRPEFGPASVRLVVVTSYEEGRTWRPEGISAGLGVISLLENTVSARLEPERALKYLGALVHNADCVQSKRGEAGVTAELILDYLSSGE